MSDQQKHISPAREGNPADGRETQGKRGWFAPTALILLVLSLMGNVVLYTFYLQNGKDAREAAGFRVRDDIQLLADTSGIAAAKLEQLPGASVADRILLKVELEHALALGMPSMERLVPAAAERASAAIGEAEALAAAGFYARASEALRELGAHEGELTAEEAALAGRLQQAFAAIAAEAAAVPLPSEMSDLAAMQMAAGGSWVDSVYAVARQMAAVEFPAS